MAVRRLSVTVQQALAIVVDQRNINGYPERITVVRRFIACLAAVIIVGGIAAGAVFALSHSDSRMGSATAGRSAPSCLSVAPTTVGTLTVPPGPIAGYCQDRLVNAAQVINAARRSASELRPRRLA